MINFTGVRLQSKFFAIVIIISTILLINSSTFATTYGAESVADKNIGTGEINLFTGTLNLNVPIAVAGGRGDVEVPIVLRLTENRWRKWWYVHYEPNVPAPYSFVVNCDVFSRDAIFPVVDCANTPTSLNPYMKWLYPIHDADVALGYNPGKLVGRTAVKKTSACYDCQPGQNCQIAGSKPSETRFTLSFYSPDGASHELIDQATMGGFAVNTGTCTSTATYTPPRGDLFISNDSSGLTFVSDTPLSGQDPVTTTDYGDSNPINMSGALYSSNGLKYRIDDGNITSIKDRNGNTTALTYHSGGANSGKLQSVTDSIGRTVLIEYGVQESAPYGLCDRITQKGVGGADKVYRVSKSNLNTVLRNGDTIKTAGQLFPATCGTSGIGACGTSVNPVVTSALWLPNGQSHTFKYTSFVEIAKVEMPQGGNVEYDYDYIVPNVNNFENYALARYVTEKRVYLDSNAISLQSKLKYTRSVSYSNVPQTVTVENTDKYDNRLNKTMYYFHGNPDLGFLQPNFDIPHWSTGLVQKMESFASDGATIIQRTENTWQTNTVSGTQVDPHITETLTTLADTGQVSKKTFVYDNYNNLTDVYEYDYGSGQPGAFLRRSHSDYLTNSGYINGTTARLRTLQTETWISSDMAGNNKVSRTLYEYDNYASDTNHANLLSRSNVVGYDAGNYATFTLRGNPTSVTNYSNASNATGAVTSYMQYDVLGNVVKLIDAKGNISTLDYSDRFGAPDNEARNNLAPSTLNGQSTFAFNTSSLTSKSWSSYMQYDYQTGMIVDFEDANGNISTTFYEDVLDRITKVISNNNRPSLKTQTTIVYDDLNKKSTTFSDSKSFGDSLLKSETLYDAFGRPYETRQYESDLTYTKVLTEYDALGRIRRASNPFRPHLGETPSWTTTSFDSVNRVTEVKTADNAIVTRSYNGSRTTAIDQAGHSRTSSVDPLGRLVKVTEHNSGTDYDTIYTYDVIGRMRQTSQTSGQTVQNRFFMFDDLGRLVRARQVEQGTNSALTLADPITGNSLWSVRYIYDDNGNVISTTDALNRSVTAAYDSLNRPTYHDYSAPSMPDVTFTYDDSAVANSKGKLTSISSSTSTTNYTAFDVLGRVKSSSQTVGSKTYTFPDYTYDLSGAMVSETYPSGRVVSSETDDLGRLKRVSDDIPNQVHRILLSGLDYTSAGSLKQARLGNGKWVSAQFDEKRMQVKQITLGGSVGDGSLLKLEFDYGTTNNNGSLIQQKTYVPGLSQALVQNYSYDGLNRLTAVTESVNSNQQWKQTFSYDRFGNRRFDANNTTTLVFNNGNDNPQFDSSTNRLLTSEGYLYDLEGNLTANPENQAFTYDSENRMVRMQNTSTQSDEALFYDGHGRRVKKVQGSEETVFVYDAFGKLVAEYTINQAISSNGIQYYTTDALGSTRIITNGAGQVVSRHDYMPFGEEIAFGVGGRTVPGYGGSGNSDKKFTGYERGDSGLDFAQNRHYSNKHGRFTSIDPTLASIRLLSPQSLNRFAYVENDPLNYTDPSGLCIQNGVQTGKPCSDHKGKVYKNRDGSFSDSDYYGGTLYTGGPVEYRADGVIYTVTSGGWTSTAGAGDSPVTADSGSAEVAALAPSNSAISTEILARPDEPLPTAPIGVDQLFQIPNGFPIYAALKSIQLVEQVIKRDILDDGVTLSGSVLGFQFSGTYTRNGHMLYGWDSSQVFGSAPSTGTLNALNASSRGGVLKALLSLSITTTKFLNSDAGMSPRERFDTFDGISWGHEATFDIGTFGYGTTNSGRSFVTRGLTTPGFGYGYGPMQNYKIESVTGPLRW